jgi:hypothetical protein
MLMGAVRIVGNGRRRYPQQGHKRQSRRERHLQGCFHKYLLLGTNTQRCGQLHSLSLFGGSAVIIIQVIHQASLFLLVAQVVHFTSDKGVYVTRCAVSRRLFPGVALRVACAKMSSMVSDWKTAELSHTYSALYESAL